MVRSGPYDGFDYLPLSALIAMYTGCGYSVDAGGIVNEAQLPMTAIDLTETCPNGQSTECCYLSHAIRAREVPLDDLAAYAMEAGQVLVLQSDGAGFSRVGTLRTQPRPSAESGTLGETDAPYWVYNLHAGLSDPLASMAVDSAGGLWVRQTDLRTGARLSTGQSAGGLTYMSVSIRYSRGTLTRIPLAGTDIRVAAAEASAEAVEWTMLPSQAPLTAFYPMDIGRSNVALRPNGSALVVAPRGDVTEYSESITPDPQFPAGPLPLVANAIDALYPIPAEDLYKTGPIPIAAFATSASVTTDGVDEDTILVAGVRGEYNPNAPCAAPLSFIARYANGILSGGVPHTPGSLPANNGPPGSACAGAVRYEYRFDAMGDVPRSPIAIQGSRITLPQNYPFPKPVLSFVSPSAGAGTPDQIARFDTEMMGTLRVLLRRLQVNPDNTTTAVDTSLSDYKDKLNPAPHTGSIPVVRVFVGPYSAAPGEILVNWPDPAGHPADSAPVVLVSPQPVLDASGQPDKRYMFFVAADGDGNPRVYKDCDTTTGTLVEYVGAQEFTPPTAVGCHEDKDAAVKDSCDCTHGTSDICILAFNMPSMENVRQYVFADLMVCGAASPLLQASPTSNSYLENQQSLVSEPLHVVFGTEPEGCVISSDCVTTTGYCVDGFCCDQPCGGNSLTDCMACSIATGSSADGVCDVLPWGKICGRPDADCALPPHCDGINETCPGDADNDGHFVPGSCGQFADDCDDTSATSYLGAQEICDGRDNNCDDRVDDGFDNDGDGFSACQSMPGVLSDCNDNDANIGPAARDTCNGIDDDCDGITDPTCVAWNDAVGAIDGKPGADGGAATYEIPIAVPPGRHGMAPSLSLSYSSRSGNGVAGMGWSISGLSRIARCGETVAQDGRTRAIAYDGSDRLCLDGERLVLASGSAAEYGADGSEYRTEIESFRRVTLHGESIGHLGTRFLVEDKSGRIQWYGLAGVDQALDVPEANGPPLSNILGWQIAREEDSEGNSIIYSYAYAGNIGETLLKTVYYTGKNETRGDRRVEFEYEARDDARVMYEGDRATRSTQRLLAVTTYVGDAVIKRYEIGYAPSAGTGRSLLKTVTECAAKPCSSGIALPSTTFSYADHAMSSSRHGTRSDYEYVAGDYDGDGQRDSITHVNGTYTLTFSSGCTTPMVVGSDFGYDLDVGLSALIYGIGTEDADVDGDGRADIVNLSGNGTLALRSPRCDRSVVSMDLGVAAPSDLTEVYKADFNADGRTDLLLKFGRTGYTIHLQLPCGSGLCFGPGVHLDVPVYEGTPGECPVAPLPWETPPWLCIRASLRSIVDVNGDGLPDIVFDHSGPTGENALIYFSTIAPDGTLDFSKRRLGASAKHLLFRRGGATKPIDINVAGMGGPDDSLASSGALMMDINGDGLPDLVRPGVAVWINSGSAFHEAALQGDMGFDSVWRGSAFPLDFDGDGREELMVPTEVVVPYCCTDFRTTEPIEYCGAQLSGKTGPSADCKKMNRSIYRWDALRINVSGLITVSFVHVPTPFEAPVLTEIKVVPDTDGDGIRGARYDIPPFIPTYGENHQLTIGVDFPVAPGRWETTMYGSQDHLTSVINGLGHSARWEMQTLARNERSAKCAALTDKKLYEVNRSVTPPAGHVPTASSMYVVAAFSVDNATAATGDTSTAAVNTTCYKYKDGLLNVEGRGFQGFREVIAEEAMPPTAGENSTVGQALSVNNMRTTTTFHQEFPLAGKVLSVHVQPMTDPAGTTEALHSTVFVWNGDDTSHVNRRVYLEKSTETTRDLPVSPTGTRTRLAETITRYTYNATDLEYGNPSAVCKSTADAARTHYSNEAYTYDYGYSSSWWLDKVDDKVERAFIILTGFEDDSLRCSATSLPVAVQRVTASTTWRTPTVASVEDGVQNARRRLPLTVAEVEQTTQQSRSETYTYNDFGDLLSKTVAASELSTPRSTTLGYSSDGYFVTTETNALEHVATTLTDPGTGQPIAKQPVQGGPWTRLSYDGFGRLLTTATQGTAAVQQRLRTCSAATCPTPAVMRRVVTQLGSPDTAEYLDRAGRVVRREKSGFSNGPSVVADTQYNARGMTVGESAPAALGGTQYWTTYGGYDALSRPAVKQVPRGLGDGVKDLITHYTPCGLRTKIEVMKDTYDWSDTGCAVGWPSDRLTLWRTVNARGQVSSTQDAQGGVTQYDFDAHGGLTLVRDAAGNDTTASYNGFGALVQVNHPDRGLRTFGRNGLGELVSTIDGRNTLVTQLYDELGRPTERKIRLDGSGADETDARWGYDRAGALGLPSWESRGELRRDLYYDAYRRPVKTITTIGSQTFVSEQTFDAYGRLAMTKSPSGEVVWYGRDASGRLMSEWAPTASGTVVYRRTTAMTPSEQVAAEELGNGLTATYAIDPVHGQMLSQRVELSGQQSTSCIGCTYGMAYTYDRFFNVKTRTRSGQSLGTAVGVTETFGYDDLHRLTNAKRDWSLGGKAGESVSYDYDAVGNILKKDDYSVAFAADPSESPYKYGNVLRDSGLAGPHAVRSVEKPGGTVVEFSYDDNGNLLAGDGRTITYDAFDKPVTIEERGITTTFAYGPSGDLYKQTDGPRVVYYVGAYEREILAGSTRTRDYVGSAVILHREGRREVRYLHRDRLGSVEEVTDEYGGPVESQGFDAFGLARGGDWSNTQGKLDLESGQPEPVTMHGFTGHEHLDQHTLIHMQGRVYDPRLGRFLTVDPIMDLRSGSQGINPYSYIQNNPLSGVDPTGYVNPAGNVVDNAGYELRERAKVKFVRDGDPATGSHIRSITGAVITMPDGSVHHAQISSNGKWTLADKPAASKPGPDQGSSAQKGQQTPSTTQTATAKNTSAGDKTAAAHGGDPYAADRAAAGSLPRAGPMLAAVLNQRDHTIFAKDEATNAVVPVAADGGFFPGQQDGIADPTTNPGMVFKSTDRVDIVANRDGSLTVGAFMAKSASFQLLATPLILTLNLGQKIRGGWKDQSWQFTLHLGPTPDYTWDNLFRASQPASPGAR